MNIYEGTKIYTFELLDFQLDLILEALSMYCYETNKKYSWRKVSKTTDENIEKALVRETYNIMFNVKNEKAYIKDKNVTQKNERIS